MTVAASTLVQTVGRLETRPSLNRVPSDARARVVLALMREFLQDEIQLAGDIVRLRAGLKVRREHVPGVGLHLEVGRERVGSERVQRVEEGVLRRADLAEVAQEDWDVAMHAPLA